MESDKEVVMKCQESIRESIQEPTQESKRKLKFVVSRRTLKHSLQCSLLLSHLFLGSIGAASPMVSKQEQREASLGTCSIQAQFALKSKSSPTSVTRGEGVGKIRCVYHDGNTEILPIRLKTVGISGSLERTDESAKQAAGQGSAEDNIVIDKARLNSTVGKVRSLDFNLMVGDARALLGTYVLSDTGLRSRKRQCGTESSGLAKRRGVAISVCLETMVISGVETPLEFGAKGSYMQISLDPHGLN